MCNRLPEIMKNGDAGIFPVYYSLKDLVFFLCSLLGEMKRRHQKIRAVAANHVVRKHSMQATCRGDLQS